MILRNQMQNALSPYNLDQFLCFFGFISAVIRCLVVITSRIVLSNHSGWCENSTSYRVARYLVLISAILLPGWCYRTGIWYLFLSFSPVSFFSPSCLLSFLPSCVSSCFSSFFLSDLHTFFFFVSILSSHLEQISP